MRAGSAGSEPALPDVNGRAASTAFQPAVAPRIRWGDLRLRVLSAMVLAPLALACVWFGSFPWIVLVALMAIGLSVEWAQLCGFAWSDPSALALCTVVLAAALLTIGGLTPAGLATLAAGFVAVASASRSPRLAAGMLYIGLAAVALPYLRGDPTAGRADLLFVLLIVWASDIAAYVAGRLIGGPRLAPSISPGKTWSGAAGGLAGALVIGAGAAAFDGTVAGGIVAAAWLGLVSQAGDLMESAIKRQFGVKDSGRLIPGHGGLLDRLDGLLAAAPAAALLAAALGRGGVLWR